MRALVPLLLLMLPVEASAKPCDCPEELTALRTALHQVKDSRAIWYSVLADIYSGSFKPKDGLEARAEFDKRLGGGNAANVVHVGGISPTGDIKIDPGYQDSYCDAVVDGTRVHEHEHAVYIWTHVLTGIAAHGRNEAIFHAKNEISARNAQAKYLADKIKQDKAKCGGRDYSTDTSDSPPGRIQDRTPK